MKGEEGGGKEGAGNHRGQKNKSEDKRKSYVKPDLRDKDAGNCHTIISYKNATLETKKTDVPITGARGQTTMVAVFKVGATVVFSYGGILSAAKLGRN